MMEDPFYKHEFEMNENNTQVIMEGAQERYIQQGSILSLVCTVHHNYVRGPNQIIWYQGANRLRYDSPRGGIVLQVGMVPYCE
ncbi:hypothetical protein SK128_020027 [Halocaridina rubra]|uniref:Ig-like domain-containing protein n=1 Tax=Halocaridina rubra TaxID=373956 RepID=A0AAN8WLN8_HALRR